MAERKVEGLAAKAFRAVLAFGFLAALALNLPGHLSADSVIALTEARTQVRQTWAPAAFSAVLGLFDHLIAGTSLYVTASSAVLFGALMSLTGLRPRAGWAAAALAVLAILTPQLLIYQGIVWRDVLFANVTVTGFILLARADRDWARRRDWLSLIGAAVLLALGAAVRQNGVVLVLAAAVALAWIAARRGGWKVGLGWGVGGLALTVGLAFAINAASQPPDVEEHLRPGAETLILQHYDVVGAVAHDPSIRLDDIARANPASAQRIVAEGPRVYSAARVDTLDTDPDFRRALWKTPDAAMNAEWREVVLHHTGAYLAHRADVFRWLTAAPQLGQCLPVQAGITGPADMLDDLDIDPAPQPKDAAVRAHAARFYGTPVYSHLFWGALAAIGALALLIRRQPGDLAMAALLAGALAFAASFFVISVACDYRYLYLVDLAAIAGILFIALDPSGILRRGGR